MFGNVEEVIEIDKFQRSIDIQQIAENQEKELSDQTKKMLVLNKQNIHF
jgi:hypothetical protein